MVRRFIVGIGWCWKKKPVTHNIHDPHCILDPFLCQAHVEAELRWAQNHTHMFGIYKNCSGHGACCRCRYLCCTYRFNTRWLYFASITYALEIWRFQTLVIWSPGHWVWRRHLESTETFPVKLDAIDILIICFVFTGFATIDCCLLLPLNHWKHT